MKVTLEFHPSASTKNEESSTELAATTVKSTDLLNCNVKTWVNTDKTRLEWPSLVKAPLSM